jgi:hypothetical protein
MSVIDLETSKVKAAKIVRATVIDVLEKLLAETREGEISEVLILASKPDGSFTHRASATLDFVEAIGQMEILKHDLIAIYTQDE